MRVLPTSKDGWLIFYIALLTALVVGVWAVAGKAPPPEVIALVGATITGFFAVLRNTPEPKPGSTTQVDSTSTVTTPPEEK